MFEVDGKTIPLDPEGFLENLTDWNEQVAHQLAAREGIELTSAHWEIIHFLREYYENYQTTPAMRIFVKAVKQQYGPDKGNSSYLHTLFPDGPAKQGCRFAGLPKPANCL